VSKNNFGPSFRASRPFAYASTAPFRTVLERPGQLRGSVLTEFAAGSRQVSVTAAPAALVHATFSTSTYTT
jgi:hypothetical protein